MVVDAVSRRASRRGGVRRRLERRAGGLCFCVQFVEAVLVQANEKSVRKLAARGQRCGERMKVGSTPRGEERANLKSTLSLFPLTLLFCAFVHTGVLTLKTHSHRPSTPAMCGQPSFHLFLLLTSSPQTPPRGVSPDGRFAIHDWRIGVDVVAVQNPARDA